MARYIDAEALTDHMLERYAELCEEYGDYDHYTTGYGDATDVIENAPTADVVPKSEVDEIAEELSDTIVMKDELFDEVIKLRGELANAKAEVAREIFEEIEELAKIYTFPVVKNGVVEIAKEPFWCIEPNDLAELKNKYTEETE